MKYKIHIKYKTGDSFGSTDESDDLDLKWNNLEIAKENLKRIKEHYEYVLKWNDFTNRQKKDDILEELKTKIWADYEHDKKHGLGPTKLKLITDDGKELTIWPFWIGCFESLYSAEIQTDLIEDGLKIEF